MRKPLSSKKTRCSVNCLKEVYNAAHYHLPPFTMSGNNINSVFYAGSYHPIQAGSIDGTDIHPHDNAICRALLCSSAGLCMYFYFLYSFSLPPQLLSIPSSHPFCILIICRWPPRWPQGHWWPSLHCLCGSALSFYFRRHSSQGKRFFFFFKKNSVNFLHILQCCRIVSILDWINELKKLLACGCFRLWASMVGSRTYG